MNEISTGALKRWLTARLANLTLTHTDITSVVSGKIPLFNRFGDLLIDCNRQFNLTSIADESDIITKHFIDSLEPAFRVPELRSLLVAKTTSKGFSPESSKSSDKYSAARSVYSLIDIGAGAGFPGIPLKILFGDSLKVTLIDSTLKKVNFMNSAIADLRLENCAALHKRAEEIARLEDFRAKFHFVISRAVSAMPKLLKYCAPFVAPGGIFIAMKGRPEQTQTEIDESAKIIKSQGIRLKSVISYSLSDICQLPSARTIVIFNSVYKS